MPTRLSLERHVQALAASADALGAAAGRAGLDAAVPSCPAWRVRDLVAHQAMVHRWAAGNLCDEPFERTQTAIRAEEDDLLGYYRSGVDHLLDTLRTVADDVDAFVFLKDAPPPRRFWARRQAHETTVHAVDALGAMLGRVPSAAEAAEHVGVDADLAVDGIDELLAGFIPRGRAKLATGEPFTVVVDAEDAGEAWTLSVGEERVRTTLGRGDEASMSDATTLSGSAIALYLGLWNRGDEIVSSGRSDVLERWRDVQRVRWS